MSKYRFKIFRKISIVDIIFLITVLGMIATLLVQQVILNCLPITSYTVYKYDISESEHIIENEKVYNYSPSNKETAKELFLNFKKLNPIVKDAELKHCYKNSFYRGINDYTYLYLDFNDKFIINNISKEEETLLLDALSKTYYYNSFDDVDSVDRIYIKINGKPYKSKNYQMEYEGSYLTGMSDFARIELEYNEPTIKHKTIKKNSTDSYESYSDEESREYHWNNPEKERDEINQSLDNLE